MNDPEASVLLSTTDGVATITLNRPHRANAVNGDLSRQLNHALDTASRSPDVRVILITGAGKAFCAGADTKVLGEYAADPAAPNSGSGKLRYSALMHLPKPVIVAVNGACAGVGLALACFADIRIASHDAFFLAPFAKLGLTAELGLGWLLPRLIGTGNAMHLLLSAERVTAAQATDMGLVTALFDAEDFQARAHDYALRIASGPAPSSLALIKRQVYDALSQNFAAAEDEAFHLTFESLEGDDFKEAVSSNQHGRKPAFKPVSEPFIAKL